MEKLRFVSYDELVQLLLCCSIFLNAEVNQKATFIDLSQPQLCMKMGVNFQLLFLVSL